MPTLIKDGHIQPDLLETPPTLTEYLEHQQGHSVLLQGDDDPHPLLPLINNLNLIMIHIPNFNDGRVFSLAVLLRQRYGYTREMRAVGDILPDICYHLHHCGFDSFQIPEPYSVEDALKCLSTFGNPYQSTTRTQSPWFRRKAS